MRGGLTLGDNMQTPTMNRFNDFCQEQIKTITERRLKVERTEMIRIRGMYDDTNGFGDNVQIIGKAIIGDIMNEVVLEDKTVQKID